MTFNKLFGTLAIISFLALGYFTPPPFPHETLGAYLMRDASTWQSITAAAVCSFSVVMLFMGNLGEPK